ncbi:uncharacterized protein LOC124699641 [Lolium rigidum]|uniref:uncharacterized protein LOC124699641 n=1 Tax=Lolium rigidum TaxID=89674 RepID=UPI001F5DBD97|nr:uncharacterized protein LOC124699641 [Lolium rigidum]
MDFRAWIRSVGTFVRMKLYQVDKTPDELEVTKNTRLEDYGILCGLGSLILCWGGPGDVLKAINWTNKNHAYYCVIYFTFSLLIMFMGLVSAKFPDTALMPMFVAGLGAWQAMIVMSIFASFHLGIVHYLPTPEYTIFSMMATSLPFTLYWGLSVQDPSIPCKMGRVLIWTITLPYHAVVWIESLGCKAGVWIQAKWENARVRVGGTLPGFSSVPPQPNA